MSHLTEVQYMQYAVIILGIVWLGASALMISRVRKIYK